MIAAAGRLPRPAVCALLLAGVLWSVGVRADDSWRDTGRMFQDRHRHTATLLPSGQVLVAGGDGQDGVRSSAELYDPATGTWTVTGELNDARQDHTATLLRTGQVLVVGGSDDDDEAVGSAELYDPATGGWSLTGSLTRRRLHTATLLPSGEVLVVGGNDSPTILGSAQLYDPANGTWAEAGTLGTGRWKHTATLLPSGKVLVAGGADTDGDLDSAELYDPAGLFDPMLCTSSHWCDAASLPAPRDRHTATLLSDGRVLVVGCGGQKAGALYDPDAGAAGSWSPVEEMAETRDDHTATLLPSGLLLVVGGVNRRGVELFDREPDPDPPPLGAWDPAAPLGTERETHTATLLPSGQVLVVGGFGATASLATVEIYDPDVGSGSAPDLPLPAREGHTATLLPSGAVLVAGGTDLPADPPPAPPDPPPPWELSVVDLFTASGAWTPGGGDPLGTARSSHAATLLPSGRVMVTGGVATDFTGDAFRLRSAELYDPKGRFDPTVCTSSHWCDAALLAGARSDHTATLLPSGRLLVVGGYRDPVSGEFSAQPLATVELFDPAGLFDPMACTSSHWCDATPLSEARGHHTATLLPSGRVLVVGGTRVGGTRASVELYDPATGAWATSLETDLNLCVPAAPPHPDAPCPLAESRGRHTATLLPSGRVLVAGGTGPSGELRTAELYDPATGIWTAAEPLQEGRSDHTATLLPSARVLVTGGCSDREFGVCVDQISSAEYFNPATGSWMAAAGLAEARKRHTATLLRSGEVLIVAGANGCTRTGVVEYCEQLTSVERYDSRPVETTRRPELTKVAGQAVGSTAPEIEYGQHFKVEGKQLGGDSAASDGNTRDSGVHYPFVELRAVDGDQQALLRLATGYCSITTGQPCADGSDCPVGETCEPLAEPPELCPSPEGFCDDHVATLTVTGLPPVFQPGWHLLRAVTAGVPSTPQLVDLLCSLEIVRPPQDQSAPIDGTATFEVVAAGGRTFQWQKCDGDPADVCAPGGSNWEDVPGATAPRYTTPPIVGPESGRRFRVKVDAGCRREIAGGPTVGQATSAAATLTVIDFEPPEAAVITPSGGEFWLLSDPTPGVPPSLGPITWSMSDNVRVCRVKVELLFSSDGENFTPLPSAPGLPRLFPPEPQPNLPCFLEDDPTSPNYIPTSMNYQVPVNLDLLGGGGKQYKVRVTVTDHAGLETEAESQNSFFIVPPNDSTVQTLILWHSERLEGAVAADLERDLQILADHPRVQGRLVDLAGVGSVKPLYDVWDAGIVNDDPVAGVGLPNAVLFDPDDPNDPNDPFGVHPYLLGELLPVFTGVEFLVLVGGDDVIPLARLEDRANVLSEEDYPDPDGFDLTPDGSTVGRALDDNQYLSDDPLAVRDPVSLVASGDEEGSVAVGADYCSAATEELAWIPDLAVGRLVETPTEITRTINTFLSQGGILDLTTRFCSVTTTQACVDDDECPGAGEICNPPPGRVLVTGYDFLLDSSADIEDSWRDRLGVDAVGADLVDPTQNWGTTQLLAGLCGDGGAPYPVASLNGHANHYSEGVPGDLAHFDEGLGASAIDGPAACDGQPLDLSGAVFYAVGCHGGLPVPDDAPAADHPFDLPQTFLGLGAVAYAANTGYGWGLREGPPGYGERMVVLMTERLSAGGAVTVGEAVNEAKTLYLADDSGCFDAYDQKSVMQWTLFGLPMYSVRLAVAPETAAAGAGAGGRPVPSLEEWPEEEHYGGVVVRRREPGDRGSLPSFVTRLDLSFDFSAAGVYRKFYSQRTDRCSTDPSKTCSSDTDCPMTPGPMPVHGTCGPASTNVELGRCSITTSQFCDENRPCPMGETCDAGRGRCSTDPTVVCDQNADCSGGGICDAASTAAALTRIPCPADPADPADPVAGCYYELNGLAGGQADLPVQPYFVFDSRLSGTSQHGVLWTGGEYQQESGWKALRPALQSNNDPNDPDQGDFSNLGALAPRRARASPRPTRVLPGEDADTAEGCPPSDLELNKLVVPTGETVEDALGEPSIERRDLTVDLEILYFNNTTNSNQNCDRDGPKIEAVPSFAPDYHQVTGAEIEWKVKATDLAGVWRVLVVVDDEAASAWVSRELTAETLPDGSVVWTDTYDAGGGAGEVSYFLQAVDNRGNVNWLFFEPEEDPSTPPEDLPDSGIPSGLLLANAAEVAAEADLAIAKTDGVTSAVPGGSVTYTLTVTNPVGPSDVVGATVTDAFPAALTCLWGCVGTGGASCSPGQTAGDVADTIDLPVGGTATYTAVCAVDSQATGTLANTATVAAPAEVHDPNPNNDSASDLDTVLVPSTDLSITKTDGVTSADPGGSLTYAIVVANAGPSAAVGAQVSDLFPGELSCTWTCDAAGGGSCTAGPVAGNLADAVDLPVGATATYTAACVVDPLATGTLANTVTVGPAAGAADPDGSNNSASDLDTQLAPVADLSITKSDGAASAVPGESVTYTLVVGNAGPSGVAGATVTDLFPGELSCTWTCVAAGGGSCTAGPMAGNLLDTVDLPLGSSAVYTATCDLAADAAGTLTNTASVAPPPGAIELDPADNVASDEDALTPRADLAIAKTDGVTSALPGGTVTYTLTVTNAGPSDAAAATVTDLFPPELGCAWTCAGSGGATCTPGQVQGDVVDAVSVPVSGTATYTAVCAIDLAATGTLLNTATVTAPAGLDPNPGNDAATDLDTALDAQADLAIAKDDGQAAATPGAPISYAITVTNLGPVTVTGLTVIDLLPPELLDPVFIPSEGSYDPGTGAWSGLDLAAGGSVTLTLDATVDAAASGQLVNQATVAPPAGVVDPDAGNDFAEDVDDLGPIVARVHSVAATSGGGLASDERTRATLTQLVAEFNEPVTGAGEAASYLLVEAGADRVLESESCALGRVGDDVEMAIDGALYDPPTQTAALAVNGGLPLPQGRYRLLVCGNIEDLLGNPLAGGDFARDFSVVVVHLLRNPNFDADLTDWLTVAEPPGEIVHDPLDADGAATSGSARVLGLTASAPYSLSQCLPAVPVSGVTFGGSVLLDSPSPGGPLAFAQVELFGRSDCGGDAIAVAASGVVDAGPGALWQQLPMSAAAMPAGAVSMLVSFVVDPAGAVGFDAYLDDLFVYLHLFADGFETGDTSRWSLATIEAGAPVRFRWLRPRPRYIRRGARRPP